MDDTQDNLDPKLEQLLRQWGANQARDDAGQQLNLRAPDIDAENSKAAGETPATQTPTPRAGETPATHIVLRWAPLAAAAVLLIAAGMLYMGKDGPTQSASVDKSIAPPAAATREPPAAEAESTRELQARLAQAQTQRDDALATIRRLREGATTQQADLQSALAAARQAADKAHGDLEKAQADKKALAGQLQEVNDRLTEIKTRLNKADADRLVLQGELDKLVAAKPRVQERLDAAVAELTATRKQFEQSQRDVAKAQEETALLKIRNVELSEQTRSIYFNALAGEDRGLAGARAAVVKSRILQRLAAARKQAPADSGQLMDGLEVALMRLSTLEAQDPTQVASFRKLLADSKIAAALDKALAGKPPADLRQLLLEAQIIITEAQREA